ncbi:S-adenosyl-L-methionine-dependent methyltransferase [Aaosphaeria arxii CBS 175.79]|uniref:S-adenosyl-L-methionine-dependent methyltransferase n=1 Tax=Aaosphaeria arxii CBS 175.79 TaxID=1450172 RepID=A0A6A5XCP6_9PLEO|nr:S-adenosyl-L-methionine-dependent methyltransferase [Aaosphaeria arxii CBS 175.79]KAF2010577.1 S-adenosyl-L-methionine-dependent methyltransferase [Aaosphaeria arxii CBS 175.79]
MGTDVGAGEADAASGSTQNRQYDQIGTKYKLMHELPAVEPEKPSVVEALGDIKGKKCLDLACGTGRYTHLLHTFGATSVTGYDISPVMVEGAQSTYPPASYPTLTFSVADCSKPLSPPPTSTFDIIFAGWFLNYAGTAAELTSMFRVIEQNLAPGGRFVGLTTNVHDKDMRLPKHDFYGMTILVLDEEYVAPGEEEKGVVGIKARVVAHTESVVQFDCFQLFKEVYEGCAREAGLRLEWKEYVLPDDERRGTGFWERWLERPTFAILEAVRL